jgi:hypothetical protein
VLVEAASHPVICTCTTCLRAPGGSQYKSCDVRSTASRTSHISELMPWRQTSLTALWFEGHPSVDAASPDWASWRWCWRRCCLRRLSDIADVLPECRPSLLKTTT